jgi:hypothetical protein
MINFSKWKDPCRYVFVIERKLFAFASKGNWSQYTVRCNEIATIVFFSNIFSAIFRNYSSCSPSNGYISKCSAGSVVLLQVQSFLSKQVQLIAISARKWPSFYSSCLVLGWRSAWPICLKNDIFMSRILLLMLVVLE